MATNHSYPTSTQRKKHSRVLHDWLDRAHTALLRRSALGLPRVYNNLSEEVVECSSVHAFQKKLQDLVKTAAKNHEENWKDLLSPRSSRAVRFAV